MISADRLKEMALEDIEKNPEKHLEEYVELSQQLNQLKIRNEELKKQYNCYACDTCKGKEDYIRLKIHCENAIKALHNKQAEYDQLKAKNEELKEKVKKYGEINEQETKDYAELWKQHDKLKQTLQEIKEILLKTSTDSQEHCVNAKSVILQKISEVLNDG